MNAKLTIVDRRGRLKADIIEACECLRAWYGRPQFEDESNSEDGENDNDRVDS
jgi:hypothetical protein